MNTALRYAVISGLYSIPFIVLVVSPSLFFPFITGKNFTFRIIIEIIFAAWLILALREQSYRPKFSYILSAFFFFLVAICIADLFGENYLKSFWSNFERMEGFVTLLHLFAYFIVLGSTIQTANLWKRMFQTSLFVSLVVTIYSFFQLAGTIPINQGGVRVDATFGNATYLAIYLVFNIFIALILMVRDDAKTYQRWIYGILIALQLIVLYHTATRGSILGIIGGLLITAFIIGFWEKSRPALRKISLGGLGVIAAFLLVFLLVKNADFVQNSPVLSRFANISWNETKTQARSYVWPMAVSGFKERPVLGWGQENFNYVFNKYYDPRMYAQEQWFDRAHNTVLDWLIAGGLLGLLGYLSLYALALFAVWKKTDISLAERALLTGLLAAYFFHNMFVFDSITSYIMFVIILSYLHFDTAIEFTGRISDRISYWLSNREAMSHFVSPIIAILAVFIIYFVNAKVIAANSTLITAVGQNNLTIDQRLDEFKKAISYGTFGNQEVREQLVQIAYNAFSSSGLSNDEKLKIFKLSESEYKKMLEEAPNDARHHLFLGGLYDGVGQYGDGLNELKAALALSPKKQTILFEIVGNLISSGRYDDALMVGKEVFELDESFDQARIMYAAAAIYAGKNDVASAVLKEKFGTAAYPNDRLLRAYYDTNQLGLVVQIWENQVKANPNDARGHALLASAYFQVGRIADSLSELRKAVELETNAATKAQYQQAYDDIKAGKKPF